MAKDFVVRIDGDEAGFLRAVRATQGGFERLTAGAADLEKRVGSLQVPFAGLATSVVGLFAGSVLVQGFRRIVDGIDALNDLKDATGASIENLSGLEDIVLRAGNSFETAGAALLKLNNAMNTARPGSEAQRVFEALGLSVDELRQKDPVEALRAVSVAFGNFADDQNKNAAAVTLFGKSYREIAPILRDVADANSIAAKQTGQNALEAEKFNKELAALSKNATDAGRGLAMMLVPGINAVVEQFRQANKESNGFLAVLQTIGKNTELYRIFGGGSARQVLAERGRERARMDAIGNAAGGGRGFINPDFVKPSLIVPDAPTPTPTPGRPSPAAAFGMLPGSLGSALRVRSESLPLLNEGQRERDIAAAKDAADALVAESQRASAEIIVDARARGEALIELERAQALARIEPLKELPGEYARALAAVNEIAAAKTAELNRDLMPEWRRLAEDQKSMVMDWGKTFDDFADGFIQTGRNMFSEWLRTGKVSSRDLADFVVAQLARIAEQQLLVPLFNAGFNALTSLFAGAATGGLRPAGSMGQVNERSPELLDVRGKTYLMMGSQSGRVTPLSGMRQRASEAPVVRLSVVNNFAPGVSSAEFQATLAQQAAVLREQTYRDLARPGRRLRVATEAP